MFGKNIPIKPDRGDGTALKVTSIFRTIQGEGPLAGEPAVFIRFTGCNLRCFYCDTDFEKGEVLALGEIVDQVRALGNPVIGLVVLTGGEPLAQNIVPLIKALHSSGFYCQIETAGTVWQEGLDVLVSTDGAVIVCSPKTEDVHPKIAKNCEHWKYILRSGELDDHDGLPIFSTQQAGKRARLYRPQFDDVDNTIWVQPCDEFHREPAGVGSHGSLRNMAATHANYEVCVASALAHGYRVSFQIHKVLGVD